MTDTLLCYICYDHETIDNPYATEPPPCKCRGSLVIHQECLKNIIKTSRTCSVCKSRYNVKYLPQKDGKELVTEITNCGHYVEYTVNALGEKHGAYTIKNQDQQLILLHSYINGQMEEMSLSSIMIMVKLNQFVNVKIIESKVNSANGIGMGLLRKNRFMRMGKNMASVFAGR